jgi:hypothetical protein
VGHADVGESSDEMTRGKALIVLALLVAACGSEPSPEEKARSDAAAVATVQAAQDRHPPMQPITPEPITFEDIEQHGLFGAGCSFLPDGTQVDRPVVLTLPQKGVFKLGGKLMVLAANSGSAELPYGSRAKYAGRTHALRLAEEGGDDAPSSGKMGRWRGSVIFTDQFERPVFTAKGTFDCGG